MLLKVKERYNAHSIIFLSLFFINWRRPPALTHPIAPTFTSFSYTMGPHSGSVVDSGIFNILQ